MAMSTLEEEAEEENVVGSGEWRVATPQSPPPPTTMSVATFVLVAASYFLSLATYLGCSFYSVTFYKDYFPATGAQYAEYDKMWGPWTLGVSFCKWHILQAGRLLESATYITAFWTALLAPCLGLAAFMMLCCSHRPGHCECICCLSGTSSFATMMCNFLAVCSILQFLSLVVLASPYCGTEYNGTCQLHRDGWLSLSAAILWMVSAFAAWRIRKSDLD
jgi:hypothetical protein